MTSARPSGMPTDPGTLARVVCDRCGWHLSDVTAAKLLQDATHLDVLAVRYLPAPVPVGELLAWRCAHCAAPVGIDPDKALHIVRGKWRNRMRTLKTAQPAPAVTLRAVAVTLDGS